MHFQKLPSPCRWYRALVHASCTPWSWLTSARLDPGRDVRDSASSKRRPGSPAPRGMEVPYFRLVLRRRILQRGVPYVRPFSPFRVALVFSRPLFTVTKLSRSPLDTFSASRAVNNEVHRVDHLLTRKVYRRWPCPRSLVLKSEVPGQTGLAVHGTSRPACCRTTVFSHWTGSR